MSTTIREAALAALFARLAAIGGSPAIVARRNPDVSADTANSADFYDGPHEILARQPAATRYAMQVSVELYAAAGADLNDLYGRVLAALLADPPPHPAIEEVIEESLNEIALDRSPGAPSMAAYELVLSCIYWTASLDPYTAAP